MGICPSHFNFLPADNGQYRVFSAAGFFLIFLAKLSRRNWQLTSAEVACDLRLSRDLPRPYNGIIVALVVVFVVDLVWGGEVCVGACSRGRSEMCGPGLRLGLGSRGRDRARGRRRGRARGASSSRGRQRRGAQKLGDAVVRKQFPIRPGERGRRFVGTRLVLAPEAAGPLARRGRRG